MRCFERTFRTVAAAAFLTLALPAFAHAQCSNPAGVEGEMLYNDAQTVMQYCDDTNWIAMGPIGTGTSASTFAHKKVFATSGKYTGSEIAGVGQADRICNTLADAAGLTGYYKAWLSSTGDADPADRFDQSADPYVTAGGIKVADDWADLVNCSGASGGCLDNSIIYDENGDPIPGLDHIWTHVADNGSNDSSSNDCDDWFAGTGGFSSKYGYAGFLESEWTNSGNTDTCDTANRFYCFQQDDPAAPGGSDKTVFITSVTFNGDLQAAATALTLGPTDGYDAANKLCQHYADNASPALTGTYRAWIGVNGSDDPGDDFVQSANPYRMVDNVKVADSWADLTDCGASSGGCLDAAILVDENGNVVDGQERVWTHVDDNGSNNSSSNDCSDFTNGTAGFSGRYGLAGAIRDLWTETGLDEACNELNRLYCFEQ